MGLEILTNTVEFDSQKTPYCKSIAETVGGEISPGRVSSLIQKTENSFFVAGIDKSFLTSFIDNHSPITLSSQSLSWKTGTDIFWHGSPNNTMGSMGTPFFDTSHMPSKTQESRCALAVKNIHDPKFITILDVNVIDEGNKLTPRERGQKAEQELFELLEASLNDQVPGALVQSHILIGEQNFAEKTLFPNVVTIQEAEPVKKRTIVVPDNPTEGWYVAGDEEQKQRLIETATREQTVIYDKFILPWAQSLKEDNPRIVDLAAGMGLEAFRLSQDGFQVTAYDQSITYIENNIHTDAVQGSIDDLSHFPDGSLNGALLKDALLFLPPEMRMKMLGELQRVLKPGGSLLLISQDVPQLEINSVSRYHLFPQIINSQDDADWEKIYEKFAQNLDPEEGFETVDQLHFICTKERTEELAEKSGFDHQVIHAYEKDDEVSLDNRWTGIKSSGFIVKLTKPQK